MRLKLLAAAAALCAAWTGAPAATITKSFTFAATAGGPTTSHAGSFTISYDPTAQFYAPVVDAIDFSLGGTTFDTANTGVVLHFADTLGPQFILGGLNGQPNGISAWSNDFWLIFKPDQPTFVQFAYSQGAGQAFLSPTGSIQLAGAVPEPSTWAMLILGFGAVGAGMRLRRRDRGTLALPLVPDSPALR